MPSVINAPSIRLPTTPASRRQFRRISAVPPAGKRLRFDIKKKLAAASSAIPIPICTQRRGQPATIPAPNQAPTTDAPISRTNVRMSTFTMAMNRNASSSVGSAWPTFNVPGIFSSGTICQILKMLVVGAKEPMPRVSKKFVAIPTKSSKMDGVPGARSLLRSQTQTRKTVNAPRATNSQPRALSITRCYQQLAASDCQLFPRAKLPQAPVNPLLGQLLLHAILRQPRAQAGEIDVIHLLVLIEAGENQRLFARDRIFVLLQTLRANFLHHALHR